MIKTLKKLELYTIKPTRLKKFTYLIFSPYFLYLENKCKKHLWNKVILNELITNDMIFQWLDANEFEYRDDVFRASDLIENHDYYNRETLEESKFYIKKEFIDAMLDLFQKNVNFDIENYVTLIVNTELKTIYHEESDRHFYSKVYEVKLQFCRKYFYDQCKRNTKIWFLVFFILATLITTINLFL